MKKREAPCNIPTTFCFFVENPVASAAFYSSLLDCKPVEVSPTFALFALSSGIRLGLWSRRDAEPMVITRGGSGELGIPVADDDTLHALYADWKARGLAVVQPPTDMDFGRTFVVLDPDGHRLRVFRLGESNASRQGSAGTRAHRGVMRRAMSLAGLRASRPAAPARAASRASALSAMPRWRPRCLCSSPYLTASSRGPFPCVVSWILSGFRAVA